jgi:hypothetical protein
MEISNIFPIQEHWSDTEMNSGPVMGNKMFLTSTFHHATQSNLA